MNSKSFEDVNINEQRRCLNELDEEIERAIQELDSLNIQTKNQAKAIQMKNSANKFLSPAPSYSRAPKNALDTSLTDSLDRDQFRGHKASNQGYLQLSPVDLIPKEDPLEEMGYNVTDHELQDPPRENFTQNDESAKKLGTHSTNFMLQTNDTRNLKSLTQDKRAWSPQRNRAAESLPVPRECTYGSHTPNKEPSNSNQNTNRLPLKSMMEYHKLSNLDIAKEKIHGNSTPENYFGYQHNLRRQSGGGGIKDKSTYSSNNAVTDRLLQYGREKDERLKAKIEGKDIEAKKKAHPHKMSRVKLSNSYMGTVDDKDSSDELEDISPRALLTKDQNQSQTRINGNKKLSHSHSQSQTQTQTQTQNQTGQGVNQNHAYPQSHNPKPIIEKSPETSTSSFSVMSRQNSTNQKDSKPPQPPSQTVVSKFANRPTNISKKENNDLPSEIHRADVSDKIEPKSTSGRLLANESKKSLQNMPMNQQVELTKSPYIKEKVIENESSMVTKEEKSHELQSGDLLVRDLLKSKSQSKPTTPKLSNKYNNVESRYMKGTKDSSKSPRAKSPVIETKPAYRPQLSKKSLEIAAKLGNSFQRLIETNVPKTNENKKKLLKEMENELTFKPKINKVSEQLDEQFKMALFNGDELHRWDQLYLMREKYNIEKEMKRAEKEREEVNNSECTFQPKLNPNSYRVYRDSSVEFADRANAWKETREKRLNKEREFRQDKEVEDCTFQPAIHLAPAKLGTSRSAINLNDTSQANIRGLDQHFEKIDKANRMKKELEVKQEKYSGKNWKRQITVPKEFQFHKRGNSIGPYSKNQSYSNLNVSTEEKFHRNILFLERGRDMSPYSIKPRV